MEFNRESIYMNQMKKHVVTQITLDDDRNVPDSCGDIARIITENGRLKLEEPKVSTERARLHGKLCFTILYSSADSGALESLDGEIAFDEFVNVDGMDEKDQLQVQWEIEDLSTETINSRKVNIRAIVTFIITTYHLSSKQIITQAECDEKFDSLYRSLEVLQTAVQKKDTFRLREMIDLPANKPNMNKLLFHSAQLQNCVIKPLDGKLSFQGEIQLFVIYSGEEEHIPMQWFEHQITVNGNLSLEECTEDMIAWVDMNLVQPELQITADYDGESRSLTLEGVLAFDMLIYEETKLQMLEDVYSPMKEMQTSVEILPLETLLMRNSSRLKLTDRIHVDSSEKVLQICHCSGSIKMDEMSIIEDGLLLEGALCVSVLYICSDDRESFRQVKGVFPFSYTVEAKNIHQNSIYQIRPQIEQLTGIMTDSEEVEIKAAIVFDVLVLEPREERILTDVTVVPISMEKMEQLPGMLGYIVQPHDTLWSVAKKFYASIDLLKEINGLTSDELKPGDRLLIVKAADEMLWQM